MGRKTGLSVKMDNELFRKFSELIDGTGFSKSQFVEFALRMAVQNCEMYEEIEFPLNEEREIYVNGKLITKQKGATEPGMYLYGLRNLANLKGVK